MFSPGLSVYRRHCTIPAPLGAGGFSNQSFLCCVPCLLWFSSFSGSHNMQCLVCCTATLMCTNCPNHHSLLLLNEGDLSNTQSFTPFTDSLLLEPGIIADTPDHACFTYIESTKVSNGHSPGFTAMQHNSTHKCIV
ncbi:hypothetical protein Ahia01_000094600 [Argonauta hians]